MRTAGPTIIVILGPSRATGFPLAVDQARATADELTEIAPGTYRAVFRLGRDPWPYAHAASLIQGARLWRGTAVYVGALPVSPTKARDMAWCAAEQLSGAGECRVRFYSGIPARCHPCPLYDRDRAEREARGETRPSWPSLVIELGPRLQALLAGEPQPEVPDFVPEDWEREEP